MNLFKIRLLLVLLTTCLHITGFSQSLGKFIFLDGVNDGAIIPSVHSTINNLSTQMTIEALVYTIQPFNSVSPRIIDRSDNISNDRWVLAIYSSIGPELNINQNMTRASSLPNNKEWVHLAATYDGSKSTLYVNGNIAAVSYYSTMIDVKNSYIYIGNEASQTYRPFSGGIDELRVWNTVRTQAEIRQSMNTTVNPSSSGLIAYWQFNTLQAYVFESDTLWQIFDSSPYNNHGILFGGAQICSHFPPIVDFNTDVQYGAYPLSVQFHDETPGTNISWLWDFGDGVTSAEKNPVHIYETPGLYSVTLSIQDEWMNTGSKTKEDYIYCLPASSPLFADTLFFEDFESSLSPLWTFKNPDRWEVKNNNNSLVINTSEYQAEAHDKLGEYALIDTTLTNHFTFQFDVKTLENLDINTASDFCGIFGFIDNDNYYYVMFNAFEMETAVYRIQDGIRELLTKLKASWIRDNNYHTIQITCADSTLWIYYDGTAAFYVDHISPSGKVGLGSYNDAASFDNITLLGNEVISEIPPIANFSSDLTKGIYPFTVQFKDSSTGNVTSWLWDFGDGKTSHVQNPMHTYTEPGIYTVILTVSGPGGADTLTVPNFIQITEERQPVANFGFDKAIGINSLTIQFTDSSTGLITSWLWNFGDGDTSHVRNPVHTYLYPDTYFVKLTVEGPSGIDSLVHPTPIILKHIKPIAHFGLRQIIGPPPLTIEFVDSSYGLVDSWLWDFGDGDTSHVQNPIHTYTNTDTFTVTLTVSGPGGADTLCLNNLVIVLNPSSVENESEIPTEFSLMPIYPNPFNPVANIRFALPKQTNVEISIYNIYGKEVEHISLGLKQAGEHLYEWDASRFSTGTYLIRIQAAEFHDVRKCVLMK